MFHRNTSIQNYNFPIKIIHNKQQKYHHGEVASQNWDQSDLVCARRKTHLPMCGILKMAYACVGVSLFLYCAFLIISSSPFVGLLLWLMVCFTWLQFACAGCLCVCSYSCFLCVYASLISYHVLFVCMFLFLSGTFRLMFLFLVVFKLLLRFIFVLLARIPVYFSFRVPAQVSIRASCSHYQAHTCSCSCCCVCSYCCLYAS